MLGVGEDVIQQHIAAGLLVQNDRINLIHYAAWLNRKDANGS